MLDIVAAEGLGPARGIKGNFPAASLANFKTCSGQKEARAAAKLKACLLYSPSYEFDDGALIDAARSGGAVVFSFSDILRERGFRRAILISKMRLLLSACRRTGAGFVFASLAKGADSRRNSRELAAFSAVIGILPGERKPSELLLLKLCEKGAKNA